MSSQPTKAALPCIDGVITDARGNRAAFIHRGSYLRPISTFDETLDLIIPLNDPARDQIAGARSFLYLEQQLRRLAQVTGEFVANVEAINASLRRETAELVSEIRETERACAENADRIAKLTAEVA